MCETVPKYPSISEIKKQLPQRCFERSVPISIYFMIQDFALLGSLYILYDLFSSWGVGGLLVWWLAAGTLGASLFCIGHDCGHGSFSDHRWLNDLCGHICHGFLLSPYWPWQKSHRQHHLYTSHLTKDKGHPWVTKQQFEARPWLFNFLAKNPLSAFFRWFPIYTLIGIPDGSHFLPTSDLFETWTERLQCCVSGGVCLGWLWVVFRHFDGDYTRMLSVYFVPLLIMGFWMIMLTYLHHQDVNAECYDNSQWSFVKGAFQTIDRTYGFGFDYVLHHISDGHVAHHLFFTQIPHYRLKEATVALKTLLKPYKGLYKEQRNLDFLWLFTRLNYALDYVVGSGVLTYPQEQRERAAVDKWD